MAKTKGTTKINFGKKSKGRKGVHSKNKTSWNPNSKNYKKTYKGQGR
jgi:hypothetical protein